MSNQRFIKPEYGGICLAFKVLFKTQASFNLCNSVNQLENHVNVYLIKNVINNCTFAKNSAWWRHDLQKLTIVSPCPRENLQRVGIVYGHRAIRHVVLRLPRTQVDLEIVSYMKDSCNRLFSRWVMRMMARGKRNSITGSVLRLENLLKIRK